MPLQKIMNREVKQKNKEFYYDTFVDYLQQEQPKGTITSTTGTKIIKKFNFDIRAHVDFLQPNYHEKWIWINFGKEWNFSPLYTHKLRRYDFYFLWDCRELKNRDYNYFCKFMSNVKREDRGNNYFLECKVKDILNKDLKGGISCEDSVLITDTDIEMFLDKIDNKEIKTFFKNVKDQLEEKVFFLFFSREHNHDIYLENEHILGRMVFIHSKYSIY